MFESLPKNADQFLEWKWSDYAPLFEELKKSKLSKATSADWLKGWSALDERIMETYWRRYVSVTVDTTDSQAETKYQEFLDQIYPNAQAADQELKLKLLSSGLEPDGFEIPLRNMRAEAALYREENLELLAAEMKLSTQYDKIIGAQTVEWEGKEVTLPQLQPVYQETDRQRREKAWRLAADRQLSDRAVLNELWREMVNLRVQIAANAETPTYYDYRWKQMQRFDYSPEDALTFQNAIETAVVPAVARLNEKRCRRLGLDVLRPWDLEVNWFQQPPLRPFTHVMELEEKTHTIFRQVDPQLGEYFGRMREEKLLDLENRKGKAPGGYCTDFPVIRKPFIFMNAVGVHDDVLTLLHEGGHAFHVFESAHLPYYAQLQVGMEFAEVASMAMELLAAPYLSQEAGGFYSPQEAARSRIEHLESILRFWPYMAVVDAFQYWAYHHPQEARDAHQCDAAWANLWDRFMPGVDWSGLEEEKMTGWQRKPHIFQTPLYYIEYGLAELGAIQIWRNALSDQAAAVAAYRKALALGGTVSTKQLYTVAGAKFAFSADVLQEAVRLAEETIDHLEKV